MWTDKEKEWVLKHILHFQVAVKNGYLPSNMYANANAAMKRAIFDPEEEQRWTKAGTPPSSTIRRALPGLKARFQRAPAAVSWTSWNKNVDLAKSIPYLFSKKRLEYQIF